MDPNAVTEVVSALAAVASILLTLVLWRLGERYTRDERRRSTEHESFVASSEWRRELRTWADECIDVLSEAVYAYHPSDPAVPPDHEVLARCRWRISSLIDRGRLFLPGVHRDQHGTKKPPAYRGFRHSGLDPLVAAERLMGGSAAHTHGSDREAIILMRRHFVSVIFLILDPDSTNRRIAKMIEAGNGEVPTDPATRALLSDGAIPRGATAILGDTKAV